MPFLPLRHSDAQILGGLINQITNELRAIWPVFRHEVIRIEANRAVIGRESQGFARFIVAAPQTINPASDQCFRLSLIHI